MLNIDKQTRWLTSDVIGLLQCAANGETILLPILADALEDAGYTDEDADQFGKTGPRIGSRIPDFVKVSHFRLNQCNGTIGGCLGVAVLVQFAGLVSQENDR